MQRKKRLHRVGLARALSKLGYCSRAQASELIRAGRVRLNGARRTDPEVPVHLDRDRIEVDGKSVTAAKLTYLLLNKPRGVITTASDEKGRETVYAFLSQDLPWVAPVGRLDKASEGLLLLTNDSEWAARIAAPETHLQKTYHVQVNVVADQSLLGRLERGVQAGGDFLRVKKVRRLRHGKHNSWIEVVLEEGKNRHIRRVLDKLGIEILRLLRVAIGPLVLGDLPKGACRKMTAEEKRSLDQAMEAASRPA